MIKDVVVEISKHLAGQHDQLRHGKLKLSLPDSERKRIFLDAANDPLVKKWSDRNINFANVTDAQRKEYFGTRARFKKALVDAYVGWLGAIKNDPEAIKHWSTYTFDETAYNGFLRDPSSGLKYYMSELDGDPPAAIRAMDRAMRMARFPADTILNRQLGYQLLPKDGKGLYHDKGYQSTVFGGDELSEAYLLVPGKKKGYPKDSFRTELILRVKEGMQGAPVGLLPYINEEDAEYEEVNEEVVLPRHSVFELHGMRSDGGVTGDVLGVLRPDRIDSTVIDQRLLNSIFLDNHLDWESPMHGQTHFESVRRVGLDLADKTGADKKVVELFAYLHDNSRLDEIDDGPRHGEDAVKALQRYKSEGLVRLTPLQDHQLTRALLGHSDAFGEQHSDVTISTCWDADKLNYGRGNMAYVSRDAMSTKEAADPEQFLRAESIIKEVGKPTFHVDKD